MRQHPIFFWIVVSLNAAAAAGDADNAMYDQSAVFGLDKGDNITRSTGGNIEWDEGDHVTVSNERTHARTRGEEAKGVPLSEYSASHLSQGGAS